MISIKYTGFLEEIVKKAQKHLARASRNVALSTSELASAAVPVALMLARAEFEIHGSEL
jgi:hypothetical protein